jgi:rubredoxin
MRDARVSSLLGIEEQSHEAPRVEARTRFDGGFVEWLCPRCGAVLGEVSVIELALIEDHDELDKEERRSARLLQEHRCAPKKSAPAKLSKQTKRRT